MQREKEHRGSAGHGTQKRALAKQNSLNKKNKTTHNGARLKQWTVVADTEVIVAVKNLAVEVENSGTC